MSDDRREEIADLLRRAAARIEGGAWCKGECAIDARGEQTGVRAPDAVAWCAIGALLAEDRVLTEQFYDGDAISHPWLGLAFDEINDNYVSSGAEMATIMCLLADVIESEGVAP